MTPPVAPRRLEGSARSVYLLGALRSVTPWYRLYEARKVFFNYRYGEREIYEAAEDEWIDVMVRVLPDPESSDPSYAEGVRWLLNYEATQVLTAPGPWFPEPIDWLDRPTPPCPDGAEASHVGPALVMSRTHGRPLRQWRSEGSPPTAIALRVALEVLTMLDVLHSRGQVIGGLSPDDFLIDDTGRLFFLASERVLPMEHVASLRGLFPPARFPVGFSAPEVFDPAAGIDVRSDLYAWAALCLFLITGEEPVVSSESADRHWVAPPDSRVEELLVDAANRDAGRVPYLSRRQQPGPALHFAADWLNGLARCLARDRAGRPESVFKLRALSPPTRRVSSFAGLPRLIRRLFASSEPHSARPDR